MRVTIEHREQAAGLIGKSRDYFVDTSVEFSEEEKAIIKSRGLRDHGFEIRAATPLPSTVSFYGAGLLRGAGRLAILAGIVMMFIPSVNGLGTFLFFGGIAVEINGWLTMRKQDKRLDQPEQQITIGKLLSDPRFTVHAPDPAYAKVVDEEIRGHLAAMKDLFRGSAELQAKQSFEL